MRLILKHFDRISTKNMSEYIYIARKKKSLAGKQHIVTKCVSLGRHKEPYCATTMAPAFSFGPN